MKTSTNIRLCHLVLLLLLILANPLCAGEFTIGMAINTQKIYSPTLALTGEAMFPDSSQLVLGRDEKRIVPAGEPSKIDELRKELRDYCFIGSVSFFVVGLFLVTLLVGLCIQNIFMNKNILKRVERVGDVLAEIHAIKRKLDELSAMLCVLPCSKQQTGVQEKVQEGEERAEEQKEFSFSDKFNDFHLIDEKLKEQEKSLLDAIEKVDSGVKGKLSETNEILALLRDFTSEKNRELRRWSECYDQKILKTFLIRLVEVVGDFDEKIRSVEKEGGAGAHIEDLRFMRQILLDALENEGVSSFGEELVGLKCEKVALSDFKIIPVSTDDSNLDSVVCGLQERGFRLYDGEKERLIQAATLRRYKFNPKNK